MQQIIGYYKNWLLVELNGFYYVVRRKERVLCKGSEEFATKVFVMLIDGFITDDEAIRMRET